MKQIEKAQTEEEKDQFSRSVEIIVVSRKAPRTTEEEYLQHIGQVSIYDHGGLRHGPGFR